MCCKNNSLVIKGSEDNLEDNNNRDYNKTKTDRKRFIKSEVDTEDDKGKYRKKNDMLDKHIRDNSFKLNTSLSRVELFERKSKLTDIVNASNILCLKVKL